MTTESRTDTSTDSQALERQARDLTTQANTFQVTDLDTFARAGQMLVTIRSYTKRVHEVFDPLAEQAHKTHKAIVDQRKNLLAPAEGAERVLKERMAAYEQEQERRRREAEEQRRQEQARLEAEARAEAARLEEEARKAAEEATLAVALQMEEQGDVEAAEQILEQPVFVPPVAVQPVFAPPVQVAVPQAQGVSFRDNWTVASVDLKVLVKAVAEGRAPLTYLQADMVALNRVAKALKAHANIPGVTVENKRSAAVRA